MLDETTKVEIMALAVRVAERTINPISYPTHYKKMENLIRDRDDDEND